MLLNQMDVIGLVVDTVNIYHDAIAHGFDEVITDPEGLYSDNRYLDFENLRRLRMIDRVELKSHKISAFSVDIHYYLVTPVGADLYACCSPDWLARHQAAILTTSS